MGRRRLLAVSPRLIDVGACVTADFDNGVWDCARAWLGSGECWVEDRVLNRRTSEEPDPSFYLCHLGKYLAIPATQERIGSGYLRAILLRYKFELSMIPATIGALAGLWVSQACGHGLGEFKSLVLCIALFLSAIWFSFEAYGSAGVLANVRQILLDAYQPGAPSQPAPP